MSGPARSGSCRAWAGSTPASWTAAPQLRVISKHGVGVDNIDLAAAAERGIPVLVATGANAVSVAEHAIALMLATVKRILPLDAGLRAGRWEKPGFAGPGTGRGDAGPDGHGRHRAGDGPDGARGWA